MDRLDLISHYCRESFWSHPAIRNIRNWRSLTLSRCVWETLDWQCGLPCFFWGETPKFHFWRSHPAGDHSCFMSFPPAGQDPDVSSLSLKLWPRTMFSRAEDPYCWFLGCFQRHLYEWQPSHLFLKLSQLEVQVPRNPQFHHFFNWLYDHCSSKLPISWESWAVDSSWPIFLGPSFLAALPLFVLNFSWINFASQASLW